MLINLQFDAQALAAPASFRTNLLTAAAMMQAAFTDSIAVNIAVGYGEFNGTALSNQSSSEGGPSSGVFDSYQQVRSYLAASASSADDFSSVTALPNTTSIQGETQTVVWSTQEKLFGQLTANNGALDGAIAIGTAVPTSQLIAVALHEMHHAMGAVPGGSGGVSDGVFDLFRFTSQDVRLFSSTNTAPPAYFSADGGTHPIADYGQSSDPSDFLNPPNSNLTPNDPFNEFYDSNTVGHLTVVDLRQMDVLGFHLAPIHSPTAEDFNGDQFSDVLWQNDNGATVVWLMNGSQILSGNGLAAPNATGSILEVGDFNGDGTSDILIRAVGGGLTELAMSNGQVQSSQSFTASPDSSWQIAGIGDFNGDGRSDILWRNVSGTLTEWQTNGVTIANAQNLNAQPDASWHIQGIADFNGDGKSDVLWRSDSGTVNIWTMNGVALTGNNISVQPDKTWHIAGVGDFTGSGQADILWRNDNGALTMWMMNGPQIASGQNIGSTPDSSWHVAEIGDFDGDGKADILWQNKSGALTEWAMNGVQITAAHDIGSTPDPSWHLVTHHYDLL